LRLVVMAAAVSLLVTIQLPVNAQPLPQPSSGGSCAGAPGCYGGEGSPAGSGVAIGGGSYIAGADRPERLPYHEGEPIPPGYRLEETPRYGLVAGGATLTGVLWAISLNAAIAMDREPDGTDDPNFDDMYWPMFIPVVGPFATIGTADSSGTGAAILALDGVLQTTGLVLLIAGFAAPNKELVRRPSPFTITPVVSPQAAGLSLSGSL